MEKLKISVACIQMCTGINIQENIACAEKLIRNAAGAGAELIVTPEMTSLLGVNSKNIFLQAKSLSEDIALLRFKNLASELGIYLLIGSLPILLEKNKCANRSFLLSNYGDIIAFYDKIHMFDVDLGDNNIYTESMHYTAGRYCVLSQVHDIPVGLTICYDLRFPHLYRDLAHAGAKIITVPSAFTKITGKAHWHVLLRARAIENGCFIIASNQGGVHANKRETYGHSMIINPWGEIIAEMDDKLGFTLAQLNIQEVNNARSKIPNLKNSVNYKLIKMGL